MLTRQFDYLSLKQNQNRFCEQLLDCDGKLNIE